MPGSGPDAAHRATDDGLISRLPLGTDGARSVGAALVRDGWAAALALVVILAATGPVRTLDLRHTPIAWLGATGWGLVVFWGVRRLPRLPMRSLVLLAGGVVGVVVAIVALAVVLGIDSSRVASLIGTRAKAAGLIVAVLVVVAAVAVALSTRATIRAPGMSVLVIAVVALFILFDMGTVMRGDVFRDLRIYLAAGQRFTEGLEPYQLSLVQGLLHDKAMYPFLYPPVSLPFFGTLAALPFGLAAAIWTLFGAAAGMYAVHLLGVRGVWLPVIALWPPFFVGVWSGNVAVPALLLLVGGFFIGRVLVFLPLLKVQGAIPPLWLLRERKWRELAIGLALVAGLCLLTLPLVGVQLWVDWIAGLRAFQESQATFRVLYSLALPRAVPYVAFLAVSVLAVVWALRRRGAPGLARLGVASIIASPALYRHGLLAGLPAVLALHPALLWLILGLPVTYWGLWIAVMVAVVATTFRQAGVAPHLDGHPAPVTPAR